MVKILFGFQYCGTDTQCFHVQVHPFMSSLSNCLARGAQYTTLYWHPTIAFETEFTTAPIFNLRILIMLSLDPHVQYCLMVITLHPGFLEPSYLAIIQFPPDNLFQFFPADLFLRF